jgi:type II secretory ATPase GspE/PulE/Tfp pilus assembly ATPase PilB-like protein
MSEAQHEQARLFPESRQISIESPPEYPHPTAIQLHSESKQAVEFVAHTLRMDPDIIQLGEIRTAAEGHGAVHAARTGHFVWTTLHVTDAYRALTRLDELDPHELGLRSLCDHELIAGLIAIRVVPLLCPHCKTLLAGHQNKIPRFMHQALSTWGGLERIYVQGDGCEACHGDGTIGRQAVAEVVITDETLMSDFLKVGILEARRRHRMKPNADKSLLANAIDLVLNGLVDPRDVHRHVHPIEPKSDGL